MSSKMSDRVGVQSRALRVFLISPEGSPPQVHDHEKYWPARIRLLIVVLVGALAARFDQLVSSNPG